MADWRLAGSLLQLRSELNGLWPKRDRTSDGSIGDQSHQNRNSDHNPNRWGVVTAIDIDADITNDRTLTFQMAEHFRLLGKSGFRPLSNGGYIIFFAKIASDANGWNWRDYDGVNAHKSHLHVSAGNAPAQFDSSDSWRLHDLIYKPIPIPPTPQAKDDKMYVLMKGKDRPNEVFLTDMMTKRQIDSQEELDFYKYVMNSTPGVVLKGGGTIETWPQIVVDNLGRTDTNTVDDTFKWYAANPESNPFEQVVGKILDKRDQAAAKTTPKTRSSKASE